MGTANLTFRWTGLGDGPRFHRSGLGSRPAATSGCHTQRFPARSAGDPQLHTNRWCRPRGHSTRAAQGTDHVAWWRAGPGMAWDCSAAGMTVGTGASARTLGAVRTPFPAGRGRSAVTVTALYAEGFRRSKLEPPAVNVGRLTLPSRRPPWAARSL